MTSRSERGEYGTGARRDLNFEQMNPHGLKLKTTPEEIVCPVCESVKDKVFPINDAFFCFKCSLKVRERKDIWWTAKPKIDKKLMFCFSCGKVEMLGWMINTRACHSCIRKAGVYQNAYRVRRYARKVA